CNGIQRQFFQVDAQTTGEEQVEEMMGSPRTDQDVARIEFLYRAVFEQLLDGFKVDAPEERAALLFMSFKELL
ncbi:MAG: hypothetical protein O7D93_13435, partial [Acidobacteria bacterium]|nr:hypothetical protein [Acidobacteriota bacterium]